MNHGLKIEPRPTDYVLGSSSPIVFKAVSDGNWTPRIEFYEAQKYGWDTDGCVLFTAQESFDAQIDALWDTLPINIQSQIIDLGYLDTGLDGNAHFHSSPRFLEVLTGNGMNGNNLYDAWDVLRKYGALPWKDLPFDPTVTQAQYFAPIPQPLLDKAAKFLSLIGGKTAIQYHWIINNVPKNLSLMRQALKQAPLCLGIAVTDGWNQVTPQDPIPGTAPGHAVMDYSQDAQNIYIYDHYEPKNKVLNIGYDVRYALQGIVAPIIVPPLPAPLPPNPTPAQESNWLNTIKQWLITILKQIQK